MDMARQQLINMPIFLPCFPFLLISIDSAKRTEDHGSAVFIFVQKQQREDFPPHEELCYFLSAVAVISLALLFLSNSLSFDAVRVLRTHALLNSMPESILLVGPRLRLVLSAWQQDGATGPRGRSNNPVISRLREEDEKC